MRQYPETKNTVVTITTAYPGASSDLVQGFFTTPLQQAVAEADGIDYLTSTSTQDISSIEATMRLNYNPNAAIAEIQAKVASRLNVLPEAAQNSVISSTTGDSTALRYMASYSEENFRHLVVLADETTLVRLRDIAAVELGAQDYDSATFYKGIPAIFIGIEPTPGANPLSVAARVHEALPDLRAQFPEGLKAHIPYDASELIDESINEVFKTLAEAVLFVIFLSLGSIRAVLVPSVTVTLAIVGAGFLMLLIGFSINPLTLLALVLAIGLVADDAIVVWRPPPARSPRATCASTPRASRASSGRKARHWR